jgi:glutathione S-transferase
MSLTLVIGNKAYSSWSLRPWIALKQARIPFEEKVIPIYIEGSREQILSQSPAGKVPILKDGDVTVWDSLAIIEYLAETYPDAGIWPKDPVARAMARSISAEMHSGFLALRRHYTMNVRRSYTDFPTDPEANENIARIEEIWAEARGRFGQGGPFLFGEFSGADAMYAPVATRFETYNVKLMPEARAYVDAILTLPAMQQWYDGAKAETWVLPQYEF